MGVQGLGCTYSGAGIGASAGSDTSISITSWSGWSGWCSATLTKTQPQADPPPPPPPALSNYWDGQWYSSDIGCISGPQFLAGVSASSHIDPPDGQTATGTCSIYNNLNVPATGCGYASAGIADSAASSTVISIVGWPNGVPGGCSATLTKTLPAVELPANPTDTYWDGSWVHTQNITDTCATQTIAITGRLWTVAPGVFLTFSKPNSFISADFGTLTMPSTDTVPFSFGRIGGAIGAVDTVESGTFIVIPALNTPDGICSMRLVKQ